jgi:hypothetical protein
VALPEYFCWTRFGTEAAEPIDSILGRKERERVANRGIFVWGIGNAIGPSIRELLRREAQPEVLFSPIKSTPRHQDVAPPAVAAWTSGETLDGDAFLLPEHSLVTSRFDPARPRGAHYALVCYSPAPLTLSESTDTIVFAGLRNLLTGRPVGPSQVTAVVHWFESWTQGMTTYGVAMRARLVYPYFIRLAHPLLLPDAELGSSKQTGLHQTCSD